VVVVGRGKWIFEVLGWRFAFVAGYRCALVAGWRYAFVAGCRCALVGWLRYAFVTVTAQTERVQKD
jgi:hypothetical protein